MKYLPLTALFLCFLAFSTVESAILVAVPSDATGYTHNIHTMSCIAFGWPLPQIQWRKNNVPISPSGSIFINTTTLTATDGNMFTASMLSFCGLSSTHAGSYSCVVQSASGDVYSFLNGATTASFTLTVTAQPPLLNSFNLDMDTGLITLSFSKPLSVATFKPTITLQNAASNPTASVTPEIQLQNTQDSGFMALTIASNDLDVIKTTPNLASGLGNTYLSYSTGGAQDTEGGLLQPIGMDAAVQADTYIADLTRPLITSVTVFDLDSGTFDMVANEAVNPSTIYGGRITVQSAMSNPGSSHTILGAGAIVLDNPRRIRVSISTEDIGEIKALTTLANGTSSTYITFSLGAINDYNGNPVLSNTLGVSTFISDTTPASLVCFGLDLNLGAVELSFNDVVLQSSLQTSQILLQRGRSTAGGYQLPDITLDNAVSVFVEVPIPPDMLNNMKTDTTFGTTLDNTYMSASQGFIIDIYNLPAFGVSATNATRACRLSADTTPPTGLAFTMDLDQGELLFTFDEPVLPSSFQPSKMNFQNADGSSTLSALTGGVVIPTSNSSIVRIKLSATDLQNVNNDQMIGTSDPSQTVLNFASGAISDYNSNPVAAGLLTAQSVTTDTTAPTLAGFTLDLINGKIIITFSEPVIVISQQQFISSITITNSPTAPIVSLTSASSSNTIQYEMTLPDTITLTLPNDLLQVIDGSGAIASSVNNLHLSFSSQNSVNDLTGFQLAAGFTQATGIVRTCVNNTYNSVSSGTCLSCPSVCREGCTGSRLVTGDMGCLRCEVLQVDSNNKPVQCFNPSDGCPVGTYPVTSGDMIVQFQPLLSGQGRRVCFPCDPICARCTGPSSTACTACSHATVPIATGVRCVQSCVNINNCFYCDAQCNGCRHNATDCAGCRNDKIFWQGRNICVPTCDTSTTYLHILPTGTSECAACDSQCNGCTGPASTDCIACKAYTQPTSDGSRVMCQTSCSNGFYANGSNYCVPCHRDCKRCSGPSNTQCFVCSFEDDSVNRVAPVNCEKRCGFGYTLDVQGGDCDLNPATWLVPLILAGVIAAVVVVALVVSCFAFRRSKQSAEKGITSVGFSRDSGDIQYNESSEKSDKAAIMFADQLQDPDDDS